MHLKVISRYFVTQSSVKMNLQQLSIKRYSHQYQKMSRMLAGHITIPKKMTTQGKSDRTRSLSHQILLHHGMISPGGANGTFNVLPHFNRSLKKLYRLVHLEMQNIGAEEITMPSLASGKMWKKSRRWEDMGEELLSLKDRHGVNHCLAPTHEEAVTSIIGNLTPVRKRLPIKLYQIGRKFRDELRPKHGLMRCREFDMKDLYTFDENEETARKSYEEVCKAYNSLLTALGLNYVQVDASTGAMGGSLSHEFQLPANIGEDILYKCSKCDRAVNKELLENEDNPVCVNPGCDVHLQSSTGIEIAHTFLLGTKYSEVFKASYKDNDGNLQPLYMGCFGIGMTRLVAAALEVLSTDNELRWPSLLAPYQICVITQQEGYFCDESLVLAETLCNRLSSTPNLYREIILDDIISYSLGYRIKAAKAMGYPHIIVTGKKAQETPPLYEYYNIDNDSMELLSDDQLIDKLSNIETVPI